MHVLPSDKSKRVTVYDQTGDQGSAEIAAWLRSQGWELARKLRGGYVEWIEHDETVEALPKISGATWQIGDSVLLEGEKQAFVHQVLTDQEALRYEIWSSEKGICGEFSEEDLKG